MKDASKNKKRESLEFTSEFGRKRANRLAGHSSKSERQVTRLAILASHPIQYQAPLFRELSRRPLVSAKVFFCWDFGVESRPDKGFARNITWDVPLLEGYEYEFLRNVSREPGVHHAQGLVNPDANERILAWRPDAVVVHGYVHATARRAILGLSRAGVPVLLRGESNLLAPRPPWVALAKQLWLRYLFRHVAGFLAIGKLSREYYLHYGIEERRVHLAPYSVDNEFFSRAPLERRVKALEWRGRLGIDPEEKVILYAAKFIPAKACHDLVEAFSAVASRARLVLVGSGPLEAELKALAQRVAPGRAHFLGFVNQSAMPSAYEMGDIFVLPSVREPWGLAVNEAMCVGKPIVATDQVGSVPDLVSQENGWVYPAGDRRRLAAILDEALGPDGGLEERGCVSARRIASWGIRETADGFLTAAGSVARQAM